MSVEAGPESHVSLHELSIRFEDGSAIVGRLQSGDFVVLPPIGVDVIRLLESGCSVKEVEARLTSSAGQPDVLAFISKLQAAGFVRTIDEQPVARTGETYRGPPRMARWLNGLPGGIGDGLFVAFVAGTLVIATAKDLWPSRSDVLVSGSPVGLIIIAALIVLAITLIHELAHLAAAWRSGVPGRIRLSTRLDSLVLETEAPAMWSRPRNERIRFYLAGMRSDTVAGCAALLAQTMIAPQSPMTSILRFIVLAIAGMLAFQTQVFMRTDLYFVLMEGLKRPNLNPDALAWLRWRLRREGRQPLAHLRTREARTVKRYALFLVTSWAFLTLLLVMWVIPSIGLLIAQSVDRIAEGIRTNRSHLILDGAIPLVAELVFVVTFAIVSVREWRRRRAIAPL